MQEGHMNKPPHRFSEHDTVTDRMTGRKVRVDWGIQQHKVPKNPFASLAQEGYMHANPEILGKEDLAHWDKETKGKKLPKKVKHAKS